MTILVEDPFTDADGTFLSSHDPIVDAVGNGWQTGGSGTHKITSGKAHAATNTTYTSLVETNESDVTISVDLDFNFAQEMSIVLRWTDSSNFWLIRANDSQSRITVTNYDAGVDTDYAVETTTQTNQTLTVRAVGRDLEIQYGSLFFTHRALNYGTTATIHGIRSARTVNRFDNFKITTPDDATTGGGGGKGKYQSWGAELGRRIRDRIHQEDEWILKFIREFLEKQG